MFIHVNGVNALKYRQQSRQWAWGWEWATFHITLTFCRLYQIKPNFGMFELHVELFSKIFVELVKVRAMLKATHFHPRPIVTPVDGADCFWTILYFKKNSFPGSIKVMLAVDWIHQNNIKLHFDRYLCLLQSW